MDWPVKRYQIIYADPPWKYGGSGSTNNQWVPARDKYEVMTMDELKRLPVQSLTAERCLLFLWVVSPAMPQCIEVGKAWGFKYITVAFVWHKGRTNAGNYTMSQCELCLVFKKYRIPLDRVRSPGTRQFHRERVTGHSKKPEEFRKRIERLFPTSKKIELFSTSKYDGWDTWGQESKLGNPFQTIAEIKKLIKKL